MNHILSNTAMNWLALYLIIQIPCGILIGKLLKGRMVNWAATLLED